MGQATLGEMDIGYSYLSGDILYYGEIRADFPTDNLPVGRTPYIGLPRGVNGLPRPVEYKEEGSIRRIIADIDGDGISEELVQDLEAEATDEDAYRYPLLVQRNGREISQFLYWGYSPSDIAFCLLDVDGDKVYELIEQGYGSSWTYTHIYKFVNGELVGTGLGWYIGD
jgi:hypothetical protein